MAGRRLEGEEAMEWARLRGAIYTKLLYMIFLTGQEEA
jgi:hypothetical protein